jgi:hypothetical protein
VRKTGNGVALSLRVTPKAASARIGEIAEDASGRRFLRVYVREAPDKGKANDAVVKLVAKALKIPKSGIDVVSGATDRNKVIAIQDQSGDLMARLAVLLGERSE